MSKIENRYEFVYVFDVKLGNPNGDPDAGNYPRVDSETDNGLVSDVCLKRKVRDYIQLIKNDADGYQIFISKGKALNKKIEEVNSELAARKEDDDSGEAQSKQEKKMVLKAKSEPEARRKAMCAKYYDVRAFGAVITTGENKNMTGQVRGPIQMTFARSIDPIKIEHMKVARIVKAEKDDAQTFGDKYIVPYALYVAHGFVSQPLAEQTGFSQEDLELFWNALTNMFECDRSAARGLMSARKLIVFRHDSKLGNTPAWKLFDLVKIAKKEGVEIPRSYEDYEITVGEEPKGVKIVKEIMERI